MPPISAGRKKCLALAVMAALLVSDSFVMAATVPVTRCDDANNPGDLRSAIAQANDGDTVDLSQLTCSQISVQQGAFTIEHDVTISGPGMDALTVLYGNFRQYGNFGLALENISIEFGRWYGKPVAYGGCIYTQGQLNLNHVRVNFCTAYTATGTAEGGGIFAKGGVEMKYSVVESNAARAYLPNATKVAYGGIVALGSSTISASTITGNSADAPGVPGQYVNDPPIYYAGNFGGALFTGTTQISRSTISNNSSSLSGTGMLVSGAPTDSLIITQSTITGNQVTAGSDRIYVRLGYTQIYNSTIANNDGGLELHGPRGVTVISSILTNNGNDLSLIGSSVAIQGQTDLIQFSSASLPPNTVTGKCAWLGKLRDNGGPTPTVALQSVSPGIDAGSNPKNFSNDQRGSPLVPGSPVRVSGSEADIGAYEIQQTDVIFAADLDGCG